jgi:hypothetical protein
MKLLFSPDPVQGGDPPQTTPTTKPKGKDGLGELIRLQKEFSVLQDRIDAQESRTKGIESWLADAFGVPVGKKPTKGAKPTAEPQPQSRGVLDELNDFLGLG